MSALATTNILDKITSKKEENLPRIINGYKEKYKEALKSNKNFYQTLAEPELSIIGEIKRASPSKGLIRRDFNHLEIAKLYEDHVDALSVLTEEDFFMGNLDYLYEINKVSKLPTLCKDFIIDTRQIDMAYGLGASCILLIASILDKDRLVKYIDYATSLGMDALVEVHTREELEKVLETDAKIIGINNRNLKDFTIDLNTTISLRKLIPDDYLVVSESGIHTKADVEFITSQVKIDGILVGESFMKAPSIAAHAKELRDASKKEN